MEESDSEAMNHPDEAVSDDGDSDWEDITEEDENEGYESSDNEVGGGVDVAGFGAAIGALVASLSQQSRQQQQDRIVAERDGFPTLCAALRRNDPATTTIGYLDEHSRFPVGYGLQLGEALQEGNTHVEQMNLQVHYLLPPFPLPSNNDDGNDQLLSAARQNLAPLLNYISVGPALHTLRLGMEREGGIDTVVQRQTMLVLLLQAASRSTTLRDLNLGPGILPLTLNGLPMLLQQTKSLIALHLSLLDRPLGGGGGGGGAIGGDAADAANDGQDFSARLPQAFIVDTESTIEEFHIHGAGAVPALVEDILSGVLSSPKLAQGIRTLSFKADMFVPFLALNDSHVLGSRLLPSPSNCRNLRILDLGGCTFQQGNMTCLLDGLRRNACLVQLCLAGCNLDHEAATLFAQFWRSPANSSSHSSLTQLKLRSRACFMTHNSNIVPDDMNCVEWIASLLVPLEPAQPEQRHREHSLSESSTNTGKLKELFLEIDQVEGFLQAYVQQASTIRLSHLGLGELYRWDWRVLVEHLPQIVHLQKLTVSIQMFHTVSAQDMVSVFRRNGSLHQFDVSPLDRVADFTPKRQRLIQAFHARNENVPKMLREPLVEEHAYAVENTTEGGTKASTGRTLPSLFPPLYQAIQATPRMAPNSVLTGLLSLGEGLSKKRKRVE